MPFDPVRDAVLNSPIAQTHPLPSPHVASTTAGQSPGSYFAHTHTWASSNSAGSSASVSVSANAAFSNAHAAMQSPTSSRRATDLSVLLNADDRVPSPSFQRRTSASDSPSIGTPRPRSSHLSHILQPSNIDEPVPPPRRPSPVGSPLQKPQDILQPSLSRSRTNMPDPAPLPPADSLKRKSSASTMSTASVPRSPELSRTRLSDSPQAATRGLPQKPVTTMQEPTRSTIPYAPRNRQTPPGFLMKPLAESERVFFKAVSNRNPLRSKFGKRRLDDNSNARSFMAMKDEPLPKRAKVAGDVGLVVNHYNQRPDVGVTQRQQSPIIGLKNFNNWVKSVLIARFAHPVLQGDTITSMNGKQHVSVPSGRILDMGCGKGGDLNKWQKAKVKDYVGVDIAGVSVDQARSRFATSPAFKFNAFFAALDCYTNPLTDISDLPLPPRAPPFDVVSMQFCMHYAFESVQKARMMLENVSRWLRKGGRFIGTIPNDKLLLTQLDALPPDQDLSDLSFGNSIYRIRFDERERKPKFGMRYFFFLKDAVEDVPEYVVLWENFEQLAAEYHLKLIYKAEFHDVFAEHAEHPDFAPLLQKMKVVDSKGESQMDEDQWEAANIYIAFAFEKTG